MANPVQWTVTEFYAQLQSVKNQITAANAALNNNKAQLTAMYTAATKANSAADKAALTPLIHQNSVLRLSYLKPIKDDFNQAVAAASSALRGAGLTVPNLSGMGVVPALVIVPVVAATLLAGMITAIVIVNRMTQAQITQTATLNSIMTNPNTTTADKLALAAQQQAETDALRKANPPPFDFTSLVLPLALVALIVLGPNLMRLLPARRATA